MQKLLYLSTILLFSLQGTAQTMYDYVQTIVKDELVSCAFIEVANLDADPELEIILTTLQEVGGGPFPIEGGMRLFNSPAAGINGTWTEETLIPTSTATPFLNTPEVMDVDEDGNLDILVQQGFLQTSGGSISWLAGPDFTTLTAITPQVDRDSTDFYWHETVQTDLDGDGKLDLLTTSTNATSADAPAAVKVEWFRHLGNGNFEHHIINDSMGGTFIDLYDVDADGMDDIVISQFFNAPAAPAVHWLKMTEKPSASNNWQGTWNYHVIDHTTGLGYKMKFYDIDSDGDDELVYVNHNNQGNMAVVDADGNPFLSGLYYFEIPADPTASSQWTKETIAEDIDVDAFDFNNPYSQGAMGIFDIGLVNEDNLPDIVVPGDGADNLYAFINTGSGFRQETVDVGTMYGMTQIVDLDGDGKNEIVAAMHNFPEDFTGAFNPPPGHLKIYQAELIEGIDKQHPSIEAIALSPNPASETVQLSVTTGQATIFHLELMDALGRVVFNQELEVSGARIESIDLEGFSAGTYFLKLSNPEGSTTKRLVITGLK